MSSHNNIDDFFKNNLGKNSNGEIPESFLNDINARLDEYEKKRKRRGFWYWLLPGLLIGSCVVGSYYMFSGNNDDSSNNGGSSSTASTHNLGDAAEVNTKNNRSIIETNRLKETAQNNSTKEQDLRTDSKTSAIKNEIAQNNNNNKQTVNNVINRHKTSDTRRKTQNTKNYEDTPGNTDNKTDTEPKSLVTDLSNNKIDTLSRDSLPALAALEKVSNNSIPKELQKDIDSVSNNSAPPVNPPKAKYKSPGDYFISFGGGAQYVINTFPESHYTTVDSSGNNNYFKRRKAEESGIYGLDFSLLIHRKKNNIRFSTGLNYSEWGERIAYSPNIYRTTDYQYEVDTTTGDTTMVPVYSDQISFGVTKKNGINKYRYLSIPLLVGYTFNINNFSLTPNAGALIGISISKNPGYYLHYSTELVYPEYAKRFLFNIHASLEMRYTMSKFAVFASPFYRRNLNLLIGTKSEKEEENDYDNAVGYMARNKYFSYGLNFGISFGF